MVKRQKPVKGGRMQVSTALIHDIERAVARETVKYNCSRSFVIATALAFAFGIEEQQDYRPKSPRLNRFALVKGGRGR